MKKKKIIIFIDWFLPGYKAGGPIQSISNFVNHFGTVFDISIITSNKDLAATKPYDGIESNVWIVKDNYKVKYLDKKHLHVSNYRFLLKEDFYDSVYFNSLFSVYFTLLPLWFAVKYNMRIVLAPRGMLGEGALVIKSFKKKWFLKIFKLIGFYKNIIWHATDESELCEIKMHFGNKSTVLVAPNLSKKIKELKPKKNKQKGFLKLFFLSRIAIKKNLLGAIQIFSLLPKSVSIEFTIIGPIDEVDYWEDCQSKLHDLPSNVKVSYLGAIPNHELTTTLNDQHVMILPTQHENFGHVIMESWQVGCPVIISKHTPWKNLESKKLGFDLDNNNLNSYVKSICHFAKMDQIDFDEWSEASFNFGKVFSENEVLINKTKQLF